MFKDALMKWLSGGDFLPGTPFLVSHQVKVKEADFFHGGMAAIQNFDIPCSLAPLATAVVGFQDPNFTFIHGIPPTPVITQGVQDVRQNNAPKGKGGC